MEKAKVFVIMPFEDEFFEAYEMIKSQFQENFEFSNAADEDNQQNILADIVKPIYSADIIIADLTGLNPNVMYELGIAHALRKKTIIITQDDLNCLPFDLKQYRARNYNTHYKKFFELLEYLKKHLHGAIDNSVDFSNPISDFLLENFKEDLQARDIELNGDLGFLDYLAEIEEDTQSMTSNLQKMTDHLEDMNTGINKCTEEINSAQKTGGQGVASFVRKKARKVASYMSELSKQLKEHNSINETLWNNIEKNLLGLLENQYASSEENREPLIAYLKQLYTLRQAIVNSKDGIVSMKTSIQNNIGLERSMNQSIRFLEDDLSSYLNIADQMCAGIDRILSKSRFIIGTIDLD